MRLIVDCTMSMAITRSIRNKLFILLILIGALPLIFVIMINAAKMVTELEYNAGKIDMLRNTIISQYLTELCAKNFHVLESLALNSGVIECLKNPTPYNLHKVKNLLHDTNTLFKDGNLIALTASNAEQLIRTDGAKLVNLSGRQHFHEAMKGHNFVSDVIISRSTGRRAVILVVPVKDKLNHMVGMIQRNLYLTMLQDFIQNYDDDTSIIVMDREGKTIAHSDARNFSITEEQRGNGRYKYIADRIKDSSGSMRLRIDGKDAFVTYSRNFTTGWIIVTIQPYQQILNQVYRKVFENIVMGMSMIAILFVVAYFTAVKATRPIIKITDAADKIVAGQCSIEKIEINTKDEFGQMAAAFNKIRSDRDAYQMEAEIDNLTKLYNKSTTENIGRMKLKNYSEIENNQTLMAFYVIDLDHFKEANDTYGHQFGDKVLVEFAKNLRKKFRPNDCIGRFGGDEFVVIIDNLPNMEIIIRKAQDIKNVAQELRVEDVSAKITASIGIAIVPQDGSDYETVFKAADEALYHVKENGRNGFYYKGAEKIC